MHFDKGSADLDQVIKVLFGTASFTGGFIGFMLDNIVPGEWQFVWILFDISTIKTKILTLCFAQEAYPCILLINLNQTTSTRLLGCFYLVHCKYM